MPWYRSSCPSRRREVIPPPRSGRASTVQRLAAILTLPMLAAACGAQGARAQPTQSPVARLQPSPSPTSLASPMATSTHVFIVVMENRSYDQALGGGYTARLAAQNGVATDYHGVAHPSLPHHLPLHPRTHRGH